MNAIKNINKFKKLKLIHSFSKISPEAERLMSEIKEEHNAIDFKKLISMEANKKYFDFRNLKGPSNLLQTFTIRVH